MKGPDNLDILDIPDEIEIPNPFEIWKKVYFATEEAVTNSVKEAIGTKTYANVIDTILENYLTQHKLITEYHHRNLEQSPFPTKHDVARVAEMVISLEDKIDLIESGFLAQMGRIVSSLSLMSTTFSESKVLSASADGLTGRVDKLEKSMARVESLMTEIRDELKANGKSAPGAATGASPSANGSRRRVKEEKPAE
ncbi:MAG: hypothetical protein ACM3QZ_03570 [Solirubrobacterales bacterium]